jgi:multidrug efflux pump subunit AcrB
VLSLLISLTPMMCARLPSDQRHTRHGRLCQLSERGFDALLDFYERTLKVALRHRFATLMVIWEPSC